MPDFDVKYLLTGNTGEKDVIETGRVTADSPEDARVQAKAAGSARGIDHDEISVSRVDANDDATVVDVTHVEH
ncbi:hypothetical protein [Aureimonas pseudogalii]|uniref:Uncharacterized protein n=1 Tax=Aureimonas pseudogalii TaxID=1744844 RepID=A0A7W6H5F2_9HYPH|nr:hypothetical protein [Aureimonas pseudogalii]MBB3998861.1 hypothetical protein [Aureimonas pseudogalii]